MAAAELGGLGPKTGVPVAYDWVVPGMAPLLLPLLAILGLLALKPNRCGAAWLIWLPLGGVYGATLIPPASLPTNAHFALDVIAALAVGLAAVWLLANHLKQSHRIVTFFTILFALAGFSGMTVAVRQSGNGLGLETMQIGVLLGLAVLVSAIALSLCGWLCRRRYRPLGLYLWLLFLLVALWLLISLPLYLFALAASNGGIAWNEFLLPILAIASVHFATLLPFLVLSSASPLFRERLKALLQANPVPPPVMTPAPEPGLKI